jgi:type IV pilus biogenesis protein CpaD/CtpE
VLRYRPPSTNPATPDSFTLQKGIDMIWLTHSSAVEASQTRMRASIASAIGNFCERIKTPALVCVTIYSPNSVGMVLRSCVPKTLPSCVAIASTSGSNFP